MRATGWEAAVEKEGENCVAVLPNTAAKDWAARDWDAKDILYKPHQHFKKKNLPNLCLRLKRHIDVRPLAEFRRSIHFRRRLSLVLFAFGDEGKSRLLNEVRAKSEAVCRGG
jgi:hypothetical protein